MPSVLDGGPQILLANILTHKRLICTYASDMARPVPSHDYVLVNRSILCNCHMESGLTYLLKSIAFCADYTMSFALNLAFLHMIQDLWPGNFSQLPPGMTQEEKFSLGPNLQCGVSQTRPQWDLSHPPHARTTIIDSPALQLESMGGLPLLEENPLFPLAPGRPIPLDTIKKNLFCFTWLCMYFILLLELL